MRNMRRVSSWAGWMVAATLGCTGAPAVGGDAEADASASPLARLCVGTSGGGCLCQDTCHGVTQEIRCDGRTCTCLDGARVAGSFAQSSACSVGYAADAVISGLCAVRTGRTCDADAGTDAGTTGPTDAGTMGPTDVGTTVPSVGTQCHYGYECAPRHCIDGCCRDAIGGACRPTVAPCQDHDDCRLGAGSVRYCIGGVCRSPCGGTRCATGLICRYSDGGPQFCFEQAEVFRICARTAHCPAGYDCIDADCVRR